MKLILANNQSEKFKTFYEDLKNRTKVDFDYSSYRNLLFIFPGDAETKPDVINLDNGRSLKDYDGIYLNGYLNTYELAASVAVIADCLGINYVNQEFKNAPSLSKISMHAKLSSNLLSAPYSFGGTKEALLKSTDFISQHLDYPIILKRADADRGIDNYKISSSDELINILSNQEKKSIWIIQEYIDNDGYYLISFYGSEAKFSIFRDLKDRPDGNSLKSHMYKPQGGINASLIEINNLPSVVLSEAQKSVVAMNRQIASVDLIYSSDLNKAYILEVNYNPQLVTIQTFKDVRTKALLDYLEILGN